MLVGKNVDAKGKVQKAFRRIITDIYIFLTRKIIEKMPLPYKNVKNATESNQTLVS